eukprot:GILI01005615.1.p1 GENE.GILI01005615.1~~GILI01005615.1.p1  ORF type:complete len:1055 (+),score=247.05 GILI01005615.1:29-3193(+)
MLQSPPPSYLYSDGLVNPPSPIGGTDTFSTPTSDGQLPSTCRGTFSGMLPAEETTPHDQLAEQQPYSAPVANIVAVPLNADPSNPMDKRYYMGCVNAAQEYINSRRVQPTQKKKSTKGSETENSSSASNPVKNTASSINKQRPFVVDQAILNELSQHIDALKELCSGPNASFITVNTNTSHVKSPPTSAATAPSPKNNLAHGGNSRSSSVPFGNQNASSGFRWGGGSGGSNVLTFASVTFALEQQTLEESYAEELEAYASNNTSTTHHESDSVNTSHEDKNNTQQHSAITMDEEENDTPELAQAKKVDSCAALTVAQLDAVALIDINPKLANQRTPASAADNLRSNHHQDPVKDSSTSDTIEKVNRMSDSAASIVDMPLDAICTLNDTEVPPPIPVWASTLMERQILKVVCSMCEFAATVADHTIKFALQFPTKSSEKKQLSTSFDRRENSSGSLQQTQPLSGSSVYAPPPSLPAFKSNTSRSTSVDAAEAARQHLMRQATTGGAPYGTLPPESPVTPHSALMPQRFGSAIFEDSALARGSLSELTAELLYHSLSVLCDSMSVFKGDADQDRVMEMIEHYIDRCEAALQGVVAVAAPSTAIPVATTTSSSSAVAAAAAKSPVRNISAFPSAAKASLTYTQQCVIAARRERCKRLLSSVYPFRRRLQSHLCDQLNIVSAYLPMVFGKVSRDTELTWFAEGFRTQHMQLLANLVMVNRHVAKAVALQKIPTVSPVHASGRITAPINLSPSMNNSPAAQLELSASALVSNDSLTAKGGFLPPSPPNNNGAGGNSDTASNSPAFSSAAPSTVYAIPNVDLSPPLSNNNDTTLPASGCEISRGAAAGSNAQVNTSTTSSSSQSLSMSRNASSSVAGNTKPALPASVLASTDLFCAVLQSTGLDMENPAMGEWAEFAIKCMCSVSLIARNRFQLLKQRITEDTLSADSNPKHTYHNTYQPPARSPSPSSASESNLAAAVGPPAPISRNIEREFSGVNDVGMNILAESAPSTSGKNENVATTPLTVAYEPLVSPAPRTPQIVPQDLLINGKTWAQYEEDFM